MKNYIFGPVISRRLGYSLGIDFTDNKLCNMDCLYCECGISTKIYTKPTMSVKPEKIINEFKNSLKTLNRLDFITFTGNGEPTLYEGLNKVYEGIKTELAKTDFTPKYALITNSTGFVDKKYFDFALNMDVVLPSVDAVSEDIVQKINRPAWNINWQKILDGLVDFKKEYTGELWVEVFLLDKINTGELELEKLLNFFKKLKPHKVQLNTVDRPPAYNVKPISTEKMETVYKFFRDELLELGVGVEVLLRNFDVQKIKAVKYSEDILLALLSRRPVPMYELVGIFGMNEEKLSLKLEKLLKDSVVKKITSMGIDFYTCK